VKRILYSTKRLTEADGSIAPFNVEYYILETQTNSANINLSTYGIEIVKTQSNDGIECIETKTMPEICACEKEIYEIAKTLCDNIVTPICFEEIIYDITNAKVCKSSIA